MIYRTVEINKDNKIPRGRVLLGLIVSSALEETESKPINEKNTIEAAGIIPRHCDESERKNRSSEFAALDCF